MDIKTVIYCIRREREIMEEKEGSYWSLGSVMLFLYIWIKSIQMTTSQKRSIQMTGVQKEAMAVSSYMDLLPNEIIQEFLYRLPVKTLMRFKCVSKSWNNLISDDYFCRRYKYLQQVNGNAPIIGFICGNKTDNYAEKHGFCVANKFLYTSENYVVKEELESFEYLNTFGYVLAASKGLLLVGHNAKTLNVYDIVSKKHVNLPTNNLGHYVSLGFKCEERSSGTNYHHHHPHLCYKVVCVRIPNKGYYKQAVFRYKVKIYSSETGTWKKSIMKATYPFYMYSHYVSKVIGGVFHWHQIYLNRIIAYDSDDPNGHVVLIESPPIVDPTLCGKMMEQLEGTKDGSLQFINIKDMVLDVWILMSSSYMDEHLICKSKWSLVSSVSLWDIAVGDISFFQRKQSRIICADPINPHIIYLGNGQQLCAYDYRQGKVVFTSSQKIISETAVNSYIHMFVHFEWPTWPIL